MITPTDDFVTLNTVPVLLLHNTQELIKNSLLTIIRLDQFLPMVVFVRHASLDGTIGLDIHNITDLVCLQVSRDLHRSLLTEVTGE